MSATYDVVVMGCGPSGGSPSVRCLVRDESSKWAPCNCCQATLDPGDESGHGGLKNIRSTTSGIVTKRWPDGRQCMIAVDCGPTFHERACQEFPKNGLSRIDAMLLTHEHADAILGVGNLRHFTLKGEIQESIPVWVNRDTYDIFVARFPYLVNPGAGRSAGQRSALTFHVYEYGDTLEIAGMRIRTIPVLHGNGVKIVPSKIPGEPATSIREPMVCTAFEFDEDKVLWMSDANKIPDLTWQMLRRPHAAPVLTNKIKAEDLVEQAGSDYDPEDYQVTTKVVQLDAAPAADFSTLSITEEAGANYKLLVLDGCNQIGTVTHFGFAEWAQAAMELSAERTILVSMEHYTSWGELQALGEELEGTRASETHGEFIGKAKDLMEAAQPGLFDRVREKKLWIRPAFDGMRWKIKDGDLYQY